MRSNEDGVIPMAQELPGREECARLVMRSNEDSVIPMDLPGRRPANARTHALSQSQRQRGEAAHGESAHNKGVNSLNSQFGNYLYSVHRNPMYTVPRVPPVTNTLVSLRGPFPILGTTARPTPR